MELHAEMTTRNRIVSLIASSTEMVFALGCGSQMVGRSHECDYPESVKDLPVCTAPKFRTDGTSYEIDQRVKAILQESLSVYRVDADMLNDLKPTHIITQAQCEVCAVSLKDVEAAACQLIDSAPQIVSLEPNSLADIFADLTKVAASLNVPERGSRLKESWSTRIGEIREKSAGADRKPTVACIEWIEPLMAAGNWMPELIDIAGGVNLFGEAGKHSPWMSFADLLESNPDIIIVTPCGFDIDRTMQEMKLLTEREGFSKLSAAKGNNVIVADGNQFFNRPGPRVIESLEIVAEICHPDLWSFGHCGKGWIRI